jgi:hypothetical protein
VLRSVATRSSLRNALSIGTSKNGFDVGHDG